METKDYNIFVFGKTLPNYSSLLLGFFWGLKSEFFPGNLLLEVSLASKRVYFQQGYYQNVVLAKSGDFSNNWLPEFLSEWKAEFFLLTFCWNFCGSFLAKYLWGEGVSFWCGWKAEFIPIIDCRNFRGSGEMNFLSVCCMNVLGFFFPQVTI
jgi:hypothetical protein